MNDRLELSWGGIAQSRMNAFGHILNLNGKLWIDFEQRGKPGKWVTLRAWPASKGEGPIDIDL